MSRALLVRSAGPSVTVQDRGRPGWLRIGLAAGGAMDPLALDEGAALLGQGPDLAALELFGFGGVFEAVGGPARLALTGAPMRARLAGAALAWGTSFTLPEGEALEVGPAERGNCGYLHAGGGIATPPVMGARATHLRAGIGGLEGRALRAGDRLPLGPDPRADDRQAVGMALQIADRFGGGDIRVMWGAQAHLFSAAERERFLATGFGVDARIDRMGARLTTDADPIHAEHGLHGLSDAVALGDVQIPGDGRPAVLMADRQPTGGYPRIATVIGADLPRMAQARPGDPVRFRLVTEAVAVAALRRRRAALAALPGRIRRVTRDPAELADLLSRQLISGAVADERLPWEDER